MSYQHHRPNPRAVRRAGSALGAVAVVLAGCGNPVIPDPFIASTVVQQQQAVFMVDGKVAHTVLETRTDQEGDKAYDALNLHTYDPSNGDWPLRQEVAKDESDAAGRASHGMALQDDGRIWLAHNVRADRGLHLCFFSHLAEPDCNSARSASRYTANRVLAVRSGAPDSAWVLYRAADSNALQVLRAQAAANAAAQATSIALLGSDAADSDGTAMAAGASDSHVIWRHAQDGQVFVHTYDEATAQWSLPALLGQATDGAPALARAPRGPHAGLTWAFWVAPDGVRGATYRAQEGWRATGLVPGTDTAVDAAAAASDNGELMLSWRGADGRVRAARHAAGQWQPSADLGPGGTAGQVAADAEGNFLLTFVGPDGRVHHRWRAGAGWLPTEAGRVDATEQPASLAVNAQGLAVSAHAYKPEPNFADTSALVQPLALRFATREVTVAVDGAGRVRSRPISLDCPGHCTQAFEAGSRVYLEALPDAGGQFLQWSGGPWCRSTSSKTDFPLDEAQHCTAHFTGGATPTATLSVSVGGIGRVDSAPAGIACGADCSQIVPLQPVRTLQLTATPGNGYRFAGWTGHCSGAAAETSVEMAADRSCHAQFELDPQAAALLTVVVQGDGRVTSGSPGIDCPGDCAQGYLLDPPLTVTLNAAPAAGWRFVGWLGSCAGSGNSASVAMNANQTCTARFEPVAAEGAVLTVALAGSGQGRVTSVPAGIDCPGTCTANFATGVLVALNATPANGSQVMGWRGDADCTDSRVTVGAVAVACTVDFVLQSVAGWQALSNPVQPEPVVAASLAESAAGELYVAHTGPVVNQQKLVVRRLDLQRWSPLGGVVNAELLSNAGAPSLAVDADGRPVVAWTDTVPNPRVRVARYNGSSWDSLADDLRVGSLDVAQATLLMNGSVPSVAWMETVGGDLVAVFKRWDGSAWVGGVVPGTTGARGLRAALDSSGRAALAVATYDANFREQPLRVWREQPDGSWQELGAGAAVPDIVGYTSLRTGFGIAFTANDAPVVAGTAELPGRDAVVYAMSWTGAVWSAAGRRGGVVDPHGVLARVDSSLGGWLSVTMPRQGAAVLASRFERDVATGQFPSTAEVWSLSGLDWAAVGAPLQRGPQTVAPALLMPADPLRGLAVVATIDDSLPNGGRQLNVHRWQP